MRILKILLLAAVVSSAASCCPCRKGGSAKALPLIGTDWRLVEIEKRAVAVSDDSFTLLLSVDSRLSGKGSCNRLMGNYTTPSTGSLAISPIAGTRMMCPDQAAENRYIEALESVDSYRIDGSVLTLFSSGKTALVFTGTAKK